MNNLEILSQSFQAKYSDFVIGCDAYEDIETWDKEEYGEMDAYFENDLVSIILKLIAADGNVTDKEVEYLNKNFDFNYTAEQVQDIYDDCKDGIQELCDGEFASGVKMLKEINGKLADLYAEMLSIICDIISLSDGELNPVESYVIEKLKAQC